MHDEDGRGVVALGWLSGGDLDVNGITYFDTYKRRFDRSKRLRLTLTRGRTTALT